MRFGRGHIRMLLITALCALLTTAVSLETRTLGYVCYTSSTGTAYRWNTAGLASSAVLWQAAADAPTMARDAALSAAQAWSSATSGALQFAEGSGGIVIEWDTDGSKIPDELYLAYTYLDVEASGAISGAHIIVNALNYNWQRTGNGIIGAAVNGKRDADLDSVILHEMGHALGLDHTDRDLSKVVGTTSAGDMPTMYSVILAGAQDLHADDIAGICSIYGGTPAAPGREASALPTIKAESSKQRFGLNFAAAAGDTLDFSVTSSAHLAFSDKNAFAKATNGKQVAAFIGDVLLDSASLSKGKGTGAGTFRWNARKGEIRYQAKNMTLKEHLAPYGATNESKSSTISVPLYIGWDGALYGGSGTVVYRAVQGRSGTGK